VGPTLLAICGPQRGAKTFVPRDLVSNLQQKLKKSRVSYEIDVVLAVSWLPNVTVAILYVILSSMIVTLACYQIWPHVCMAAMWPHTTTSPPDTKLASTEYGASFFSFLCANICYLVPK
jgi:hypothetical protein